MYFCFVLCEYFVNDITLICDYLTLMHIINTQQSLAFLGAYQLFNSFRPFVVRMWGKHYLTQESKEIRLWPINVYTSPMMTNKITLL